LGTLPKGLDLKIMKKFFAFLSILFLPSLVFGQTIGTLPTFNIEVVIYRLANILFYLLVLLSVIFVIIGGITIATSGGDPNRVELGKRIIVFALVGLIIGALSFGIVNLFYGYIAAR